ncbi:MAG: signal peptide peptidase SppA [archaeon]|nr:signal peptide peptidase SppA [Candidatus Micrarchaeota archaeon]
MKKPLLFLFVIGFLLVILIGLALLVAFLFLPFQDVSTGGFFGAKQIALIPVKGEILSEETGFTSFASSQKIVDALDKAENDPRVGAIFLDIDSPGGTIVATKQIVAKLRSMNKPKVAWIGESGASGAYYLAAASDFIMADEDSITGSIGVLSISPNIEGLLEKIGVKVNVLKEGNFKAMGSPFEEMTEEEEQLLQQLLSDAFSHFKRDVLELRKGKITKAEFERIADGRILSGSQAKESGLVDELGNREEAIQKAAELAGIQGKPVLKNYVEREDVFSMFSNAGYSFGTGFISAIRTQNKPISIQT